MNLSSRGCDQTGMGLLGALQGRRKNRRIQKQLHKAPLVFDGEVNDLGFVDCPVCDLLRGGNHKIADTAALQFRGAPDNSKRIGRNASFDTRSAACLPRHGYNAPLSSIVRDYASHYNRGTLADLAGSNRRTLNLRMGGN